MRNARGVPLAGVADRLAQRPELAVLFIVDGCRADALYGALDGGGMPRLSAWMRDVGSRRFENCVTVFPAVTVACHASLLTGAYPGRHGIVGNNWFIRKKWAGPAAPCELFQATREYVKYSWQHPWSDPGLMNGFFTGDYFSIANADLSHVVKTLYELCDAAGPPADGPAGQSLSVLEMITRGAHAREFIDLDDLSVARGKLFNFFTGLRARWTGRPALAYVNNPIDWRAFDNLIHALHDGQDGGRPALAVVWLPGMDGFSHANGAGSQPEYFRARSRVAEWFVGNMDRQFGRLRRALRRHGLEDSTLVAVTADHGQYDCEQDRTIAVERVYAQLRADPEAEAGETWPLGADGQLDESCTDASIVVSQNGGACHLYVRSEQGWGHPPGPERLLKFAPPLAALEGTDQVLVRDGFQGYRVWADGQLRPLSTLDAHAYPLAEERVNSLAETLRAGDIILSAQPGYNYEGKPLRGEHGSLGREDALVPLLFLGKGLGAETDAQTVARTIDVAPTLAHALGALARLERTGTRGDKLAAILTALERHVQGGLYCAGARQTLRRFEQSVVAERVERDWHAEEDDMRQNFEAKAAAYLSNGLISPAEHDALQQRYTQVPRRAAASS